MLRAIDIYSNVLSINKLQSCRFWPTCSSYAREAIKTHGALRGGYATIRRLLRCHPFASGGMDPVH